MNCKRSIAETSFLLGRKKNEKEVVSLLLVTTMVASLAAGCGDSSSSGDGTEKTGKKVETVDDGHTLTAWAWDANFNIPALKAAAEDYKKNVDPDFVLNIEEQSQSSDIETAITTAGSAGDYSTLPDIVYFRITTSGSTIQIILMHGYQQMMQMLSGMISARRNYHSLQSTESTLDSLLITEQLSLLTEQIFLSRQDTQSMI